MKDSPGPSGARSPASTKSTDQAAFLGRFGSAIAALTSIHAAQPDVTAQHHKKDKKNKEESRRPSSSLDLQRSTRSEQPVATRASVDDGERRKTLRHRSPSLGFLRLAASTPASPNRHPSPQRSKTPPLPHVMPPIRVSASAEEDSVPMIADHLLPLNAFNHAASLEQPTPLFGHALQVDVTSVEGEKKQRHQENLDMLAKMMDAARSRSASPQVVMDHHHFSSPPASPSVASPEATKQAEKDKLEKLRRRFAARQIRFVQHDLINRELQAIMPLVYRDFVYTWYTLLSERETVIDTLVDVNVHVVRDIQTRCLKVDCLKVLMEEVPFLLRRHIMRVRQRQCGRTDGVPHHFAVASGQKVEYFRLMASIALRHVLPESERKAKAMKLLLREVIANTIFAPLLHTFSQPSWWWQSIHLLLTPAGPDVDPPPPEGVHSPLFQQPEKTASAPTTDRLHEVRKWKLHHQSLQQARQNRHEEHEVKPAPVATKDLQLPPHLTLTTPEEVCQSPLLSIRPELQETNHLLGRPRSPAISLSREGLAAAAAAALEQETMVTPKRETMAQTTCRFAQSSKRAFLLTMAQLGHVLLSLWSYLLPFYQTEGVVWQHLPKWEHRSLVRGWTETASLFFGGRQRFAWWFRVIWFDLWWHLFGRLIFYVLIGGQAGVNRIVVGQLSEQLTEERIAYLFRTFRRTLWPGNVLAPTPADLSEEEKTTIRQASAVQLRSLLFRSRWLEKAFYAVEGRQPDGSAHPDPVEDLLELFHDPKCNESLLLDVLDLLMISLFPAVVKRSSKEGLGPKRSVKVQPVMTLLSTDSAFLSRPRTAQGVTTSYMAKEEDLPLLPHDLTKPATLPSSPTRHHPIAPTVPLVEKLSPGPLSAAVQHASTASPPSPSSTVVTTFSANSMALATLPEAPKVVHGARPSALSFADTPLVCDDTMAHPAQSSRKPLPTFRNMEETEAMLHPSRDSSPTTPLILLQTKQDGSDETVVHSSRLSASMPDLQKRRFTLGRIGSVPFRKNKS